MAGIDLSKMKAKLEKSEKEGKRTFFKPKLGTEYNIRVLPPSDGDPFKERWMHYGMGFAFVCPKKTYGEENKCKACDLNGELWDEANKSGTESAKKMAKDTGAKQRFYTQVLDRAHEIDGGKIYGYSKTVYQWLLKKCNNPDYGDISDPKDGTDIILKVVKPDKKQFQSTDLDARRKASNLISSAMKEAGITLEKLMDECPKISDEVDEISAEEIIKRVDDFLNKGTDTDNSEGDKKYAEKQPDSSDDLASKLKEAGSKGEKEDKEDKED